MIDENNFQSIFMFIICSHFINDCLSAIQISFWNIFSIIHLYMLWQHNCNDVKKYIAKTLSLFEWEKNDNWIDE